MNLYFDCEFTGLHRNTTLISLGIVSEDGRKFYAEFTDYDRNQCDEWIKENVLNNLYLKLVHWNPKDYERIRSLESDGWKVDTIPRYSSGGLVLPKYVSYTLPDGSMKVCGESSLIAGKLRDWISQFESIQFVSDVCHYDFVLLIGLFGTAWDLPENVSPVCLDINPGIARYFGISEKEAFDKSREEIVKKLCGYGIEGKKHNALYDAEVIKEIYDRIYCGG